MTENEISKIVVEEAIYIHKSIGPGMLESAYAWLTGLLKEVECENRSACSINF